MSFQTIGVWVKSKTKSFNFWKWESEFEKMSDDEFEFHEKPTKVIRYIHYLKTSIDFHKVIILVEKSDFIFMQYYFDQEDHNFKTDLPHGISKTNSRPHKRTKESVKIAIKESISRPKDVVNDLFQHAGGTLGIKSTSDFPKSCKQVKDLRRNNAQRTAK